MNYTKQLLNYWARRAGKIVVCLQLFFPIISFLQFELSSKSFLQVRLMFRVLFEYFAIFVCRKSMKASKSFKRLHARCCSVVPLLKDRCCSGRKYFPNNFEVGCWVDRSWRYIKSSPFRLHQPATQSAYFSPKLYWDSKHSD